MKKLKFIDLFCGIGGFRIAFEKLGCECVFSSDNDKWVKETYKSNFGEAPEDDITKIESSSIPSHDILCAGFPCQPFSTAGYRKGFLDTRGTLFFEIEKIIKAKNPEVIFLENVKGLVNHDKGKTFEIILSKLEILGYNVHYKILNSKDYGVPQNRERVYIIGFKNHDINFRFPEKMDLKLNIGNILEKDVKDHYVSEIAKKNIKNNLKKYLEKNNISKDFPLFASEVRPSRTVFRNDGISPCLTAKMGTGGNNVPILVDEMRKLTIRECLKIQGFPDSFYLRNNNSQSYKQIGNSVSVPVISLLAKEIIKYIKQD